MTTPRTQTSTVQESQQPSQPEKEQGAEMKQPSAGIRHVPIQGIRPRAESDVDMAKVTSSSEAKDADELMLWLSRYPVDRNHPRPTTGTIHTYKSGEVMTVQSDEKVSRIFQKLITEGFLAAPVLDATHRYTGYNIDMLDLVHHTLQCFHEWRTGTSASSTGPAASTIAGAGTATTTVTPTTDYWNTYFQRDEFIRSHAMDVITRNPWRVYKHEHVATKDFSTLYCMEVMARLAQHRVIVIDRDWVVQNIVTQSMIISLISQNMERLGSLRHMKVESLIDYLPANVESVHQSELTADAFNYMVRHHVSGVAVLNAAGNLVDTLSVRDLRGIGSNGQHFMRLWLPVAKFKEEVRGAYQRQTPARPLFVTPSDTFENIIENMFDGNIHRVWIVKSASELKPLKVCTQRDVIRILLFKMGQQPTLW